MSDFRPKLEFTLLALSDSESDGWRGRKRVLHSISGALLPGSAPGMPWLQVDAFMSWMNPPRITGI